MADRELVMLKVKYTDKSLFDRKKAKEYYEYLSYHGDDKPTTLRTKFNPAVIRKLISNPYYYKQLVEWYEDVDAQNLVLPDYQTLSKGLFLELADVSCTEVNKLFRAKTQEKIQYLKDNASLEHLAKVYPAYSVSVAGKLISIITSDLIQFLLYEHKNIDYTNEAISHIHGIGKKEFFYVLKQFITDYHIAQSYDIPESTKRLISSIQIDEKVDTYSIDKVESTYDTVTIPLQIHPELKSYIYDGMPSHYSDTEKAIYIYIKLCKTLSYDPMFYAENENSLAYASHLDPKKIEDISPSNPHIVCYEINKLYALFLEELGIPYQVVSKSTLYASGHARLTFKSDGYIVDADTLSSIVGSDILNAKIHEDIEGLTCQNKSKTTKARFTQILDNVYEHIKKTDRSTHLDDNTFNGLKDTLFSMVEKPKDITLEDKVEVLGKMIQHSTLPEVEKNSLLLRKFSKIFPNEDTHKVVIISEKQDINEKYYSNGIILAILDSEPSANPQNYRYLIYRDGRFEDISQATIQHKLDTKLIQCHNGHYIPGIQSTLDDDTVIHFNV